MYRGTNDFKKDYQPRTIIVKDEKGDLVADSHIILTRWRNHFYQLLNVHGVNHLTPNDHFSGRTAPLTSRCCIFYLFNKYTY